MKIMWAKVCHVCVCTVQVRTCVARIIHLFTTTKNTRYTVVHVYILIHVYLIPAVSAVAVIGSHVSADLHSLIF